MSRKKTKETAPAETPKDKSPYVFQHSKIDYDLSIRELPWTPKQIDLIDLIEDKSTRLVLISGPAGSSKSCISIYTGLHALQSRKNSHIIYCRPLLESADSGSRMGFLPGTKELKEEPYKRVINEKLAELLPKGDIEKLTKENRIEFTEVNYIRGASMNAVFLVADEVQNYTFHELVTLITRLGKYSKVILCADPEQSDLPIGKQGGFVKLWNMFNDDESKEKGIYSFEFTEDDIMRSELCKYIVKKVKLSKSAPAQDNEWRPSR